MNEQKLGVPCGDSSTKGDNGTGLGLWVTREIVARRKGSLRVRRCHAPGSSWTNFCAVSSVPGPPSVISRRKPAKPHP